MITNTEFILDSNTEKPEFGAWYRVIITFTGQPKVMRYVGEPRIKNHEFYLDNTEAGVVEKRLFLTDTFPTVEIVC
jgi:hypothetical protein